MNKWFPVTDKVAAGGTAGLIATLVVSAASWFGATLPDAVVSVIVFVVMFAAAYVKTETKLGPKLAAVADEVLADMENEGPAR